MSGRPFDVSVIEHAGGVIVRVRGEVDLVTAPVLQRQLDAALTAGHAVVVDLSETTVLDARGVAVLVAARKQVARGGGSLRIRRPAPIVRKVLELAEQADRLEIE